MYFDYAIAEIHSIMRLFVHYSDVIMSAVVPQITSLTIVYSTAYSAADQRKHQSSASLAFVRGIHRWQWIPHTKGQWYGKCFHLMTSSYLDNKNSDNCTIFASHMIQKLHLTSPWNQFYQSEIFIFIIEAEKKWAPWCGRSEFSTAWNVLYFN